ncbi:MAG: internal scaffolding protein [Microvirus sp.]|nr:MAG: internal scaffolding protein [Microvirus sp.]
MLARGYPPANEPRSKSLASSSYITNLINHSKPLWVLGLKEPNMQTSTPLRFRHAYGPRFAVRISFTGPGRTKQEFKDECDINVLMAKYLRTGQMDHVNTLLPQFEDVTDIDFQSAQNLIADAMSLFEGIPSAIRNRFDNQPGKLLDWVHDPKNAKEASDLGFLDLSKCPPGYYTAPTPPSTTPPAPPAA